MANLPEVWLRGPLPGYAAELLPVAHALLQAREDLERHAATASVEELWERPGGAAAAGFHIRHLAGSIDRLFTYARGEMLDEGQRGMLTREGEPGASAAVLISGAQATIDRALEQLRATPRETLLEPREVGRARLPSTVLGVLMHAAEHTTRHLGQMKTTLKILRGR